MDQFDLTKYLNIALKRKYWVIIPFLLTILVGLTYILLSPRIYEAEVLILIQQQKVPEDFVRPVVAETLDAKLKMITHQVISRANLERIIKEYELYNEVGTTMTMEEKINLLRKKIKIEVERIERGSREVEPTAFTIAVQGKNPRKVTEVTNALASSFITENLRIRESHTIGTSEFLSEELGNIERRIANKEIEVKQYREKYMGGLPGQLQTNLTILDRLHVQLNQYDDSLRDEVNRKVAIQKQLEEEIKSASITSASPGQDGAASQLIALKTQLATLETRYTENHPDVIRLRILVAKIEKEQSSTDEALSLSRTGQALRQQLRDIELRIRSLQANVTETKAQIALYQKKIDETPRREQELLSLRRDYENLKDIYNSLLERKLEADIAVSMEKKQKGEQFRIMDLAKMPTSPAKPNTRAIAFLTFMLALGAGAALGYAREAIDTTFKTPQEAEKELRVPILVTVPFRYTQMELRIHKIQGVLKAASVAVGFVICAVGIVLATKGMDTTLDFAKNLLDKTMITYGSSETSSLAGESQNPPAK